MSVNIQPRMHDSADAGIDVYTDDDKISPDEARRLAAALLRAADVLDGSGGRLGARIVRVPGLGRDGVWLEDYEILLVDSTLTAGEAKGLLADIPRRRVQNGRRSPGEVVGPRGFALPALARL